MSVVFYNFEESQDTKKGIIFTKNIFCYFKGVKYPFQ